MKMLKSLMLGTAAGMLAVAGAQAADLPVKAKPAQYVKICSAYGAGFYYIPGTDICLRVGGWIYQEFSVNNRGDAPWTGYGIRDRDDSWITFRVRQAFILDARTNTEYGTLRSYFLGGFQWDTNLAGAPMSQSINGGNWTWYYSSAFIQFAGFTFGLAKSNFNFDSQTTYTQYVSFSNRITPQIAYTAQLGSGISATIAVEDATSRRNAITDDGLGAGAQQTVGRNIYAGQFMPDIVGNIRVDQAWGDAQISGAVHQAKTNFANNAISNKYGYAVLGGIRFKLPQIGAGDTIQFAGAWSKGAVEYAGVSNSSYTVSNRLSYITAGKGGTVDLFDSYVDGNGQHLTEAASFMAEFRHFWTPTLRSTIGYGYLDYDVASAANAMGYTDGTAHQVNANLIWSPVKNLDIGTEIYWASLKAKNGTPHIAGGDDSFANNGSNDWWGGTLRVTRYW